jgi:hypothetical protein
MDVSISVATKAGRVETRFSEVKSALEADGQKVSDSPPFLEDGG